MLKKILSLTEKQLIILALIIYLIGAYFNYGHNTGDEYSQIYEFAAYKLGFVNYNDLRLWEYDNQMRPGFQVWLVYLAYHALAIIHPEVNIFILNYLIQASSALLSLGIMRYAVRVLAPTLNPDYRKLLLCLSLFTWLGVYTSLHFNGENIAGKLYLLSLLYIWQASNQRQSWWCLLAGLVFAMAFACRFQIAFSAVGVVIWLVIWRKLSFFQWFNLIFSALISLGLFNLVIDHWFYGGWPVTAYNYYYQNIVTGTMNSYGTDPFYTYLPMVAGYLPWGPMYILATAYFCYRNPRHLFTFAILPFVVIHSVIGHKEVRFLLPLIGLMPYILTWWLAELNFFAKMQQSLSWRRCTSGIVWLNLIAYLSLLLPAATELGGWKFIYNNYPKPTTIFYNASKDRKLLFYIRPGTNIIPVSSSQNLTCPAQNTCLYLLDADKIESNIAGTLVYSFFPLSLQQYNYNNWMKNIGHFNVYQIAPQ